MRNRSHELPRIKTELPRIIRGNSIKIRVNSCSKNSWKFVPKGFTLLEVLIATVIFTVGVTAIIWVFNTGMFASTDVENVDLALNIAQANMEMIKNQNFTDIDTDAEISSIVSNLGFSDFTVSGDVAEGQNPMQVDVTVTWNPKDGQTSLTLTTLIADYSTQ